MRRLTRAIGATLAAPALLAALLVVAASPAAAADDDVVAFEGGGWGHSVGMSQYGALGFARFDDWKYDRILSHFYSGSSVATMDTAEGEQTLWVNLTQERTAVEFVPRGPVPFTIKRHPDGTEVVATDGADITVSADAAGCRVVVNGAEALPTGSCTIDFNWDGWVENPTSRLEMPRVRSTSGTWIDCDQRDWNVGLDKVCAYSRGTIRINPDNGFSSTPSVHVSAHMTIDSYALGISEMPYYWGRAQGSSDWNDIDPKGLEALKAQAVAARSYALRRAIDAGTSRWPVCWCHVYDTTVDQRYVGWGHGQTPWTRAVEETANQIILHPDSKDSAGNWLPVPAYYSSSTFGATEPNEIGFGSSVPVAYLRSVPDPWSADPSLNGNARWTETFTKAQLAARLGMTSVTDVTVEGTRSPSGAIAKVRFHGTPSDQVISARHLRGRLGLKSPQVSRITINGQAPGQTDPQHESAGVHDPRTGIFTLHRPDAAALDFYYGNPLDMPYAGDWDCDGVTTLGLYRVSTGFLFLRNRNTQGIADVEIYYGDPGDQPIAGDWDGDGCETVGIFRPSNTRFYLRNTNTQGIADVDAQFGQAGDVPIAGDWDGDGIDTYGVYRPSNKTIYLANSASDPQPDFVWVYSGAEAGDKIVAGDWDGDGVDTVGVYRPADRTFYLRDTFTQSSANVVITLGAGHMTPVAGYWGG